MVTYIFQVLKNLLGKAEKKPAIYSPDVLSPLPVDIIHEIFSHLDVLALTCMRATSQSYKRLVDYFILELKPTFKVRWEDDDWVLESDGISYRDIKELLLEFDDTKREVIKKIALVEPNYLEQWIVDHSDLVCMMSLACYLPSSAFVLGMLGLVLRDRGCNEVLTWSICTGIMSAYNTAGYFGIRKLQAKHLADVEKRNIEVNRLKEELSVARPITL